MLLTLTDEQQQIEAAVSSIIKGARRRPATAEGNSDVAVGAAALDALLDDGFLDVAVDGSLIDAVLVVEQAAREAVTAPIASRAVVAPLLGLDLPARVGLCDRPHSAIARFGESCDAFLGISDDQVLVADRDDCQIDRFPTRFGYPMARVSIRRGHRLDSVKADTLRRGWQLAIGAELAGLASAAIEHTARYVSERRQFGRPIGSFQAVQHRLALSFIHVEAARWLVRQAASMPDDEYLTASAAAAACHAARMAYTDTHQVSGAMGITTEHGLVAWTLKMLALQQELGGQRAHARRVAATRATSRNGTNR